MNESLFPFPDAEAFEAVLRRILCDHFPVEIKCDHDAKTDQVACDRCGWMPNPAAHSVYTAKEAWAQHVLNELALEYPPRMEPKVDADGEVRFQCPGCGVSFAVPSEQPERIFCGPSCARAET